MTAERGRSPGAAGEAAGQGPCSGGWSVEAAWGAQSLCPGPRDSVSVRASSRGSPRSELHSSGTCSKNVAAEQGESAAAWSQELGAAYVLQHQDRMGCPKLSHPVLPGLME